MIDFKEESFKTLRSIDDASRVIPQGTWNELADAMEAFAKSIWDRALDDSIKRITNMCVVACMDIDPELPDPRHDRYWEGLSAARELLESQRTEPSGESEAQRIRSKKLEGK